MEAKFLFDVSGKSVLVTGGSRGIGRMIAEAFVANGAVVFICSRSQRECQDAVQQLLEKYKTGNCYAIVSDLRKSEDLNRLVEELESRLLHKGGLFALCNNAGANWAEPFPTYSHDGLRRVMALNFESVFALTQRCLPLLLNASSDSLPARIINIGSINGIEPPSNIPSYAYSASKAALHMFTRHLSSTLAPKVTVNCIAPGPFESKMMKETLAINGYRIIESNPMKRIGRPNDIAAICLWLCGAGGSYVNGAVIPLDGGSLQTSSSL
eukprot:Partr_v1_DN28833_c4_g1_i6_m34045 putative )-reductase